MSWKKFFIGVGFGAAAAAILLQQKEGHDISAEKALKNVKNTFKEKGPISGSWIHMVPEKINKNGLDYSVYRGGVSRHVNDEAEQYEFLVDTKTGGILEVQQIS